MAKVHMYFIGFLKPCRAPHELGKLWDIEYELMEKGYRDGVKKGASIWATRSSKYSLTPLN
jgi:hypothetical protein